MVMQGSVQLRELLRRLYNSIPDYAWNESYVGELYAIANKAITELGTVEAQLEQADELVVELEAKLENH